MNEQYYKLDRREMLQYLPGQINTLLDVGCSEGNFGKLVKDTYHCEVWGIEPVYGPFKVAEKKLDKVFNIFFSDDFKPEKRFDVITFNDVLEHIPDPWAALKHCKNLLSESGSVVASIPNILYFHDFANMLLTRNWKYEDAGIFDRTHLRFFTKKSIYTLFTESGFAIESIKGIRPTDSKKFYLFNLATLGYWAESQFLQYAVVAKPVT
jgi:2-polyprenyl-3-methyl-5-hydroxy-6-metoxy-1,4-benzoquinol methylase